MTDIKLIGAILNNNTSLNIIKLLLTKEMNNTELARELNLSQGATHFHIHRLMKMDLLCVEKTGPYEISYKMKPNFVNIITSVIGKEFK